MNSWEKEFYPFTAEEACYTELQAVDHSILKWKGLTKENLEKHDLVKEHDGLRIIGHNPYFDLRISAKTCALCLRYNNDGCCDGCPLAEVRGDINCSESIDGENSPFDHWVGTGNPQPMIEWLEKARELVLRKQLETR